MRKKRNLEILQGATEEAAAEAVCTSSSSKARKADAKRLKTERNSTWLAESQGLFPGDSELTEGASNLEEDGFANKLKRLIRENKRK